MPLQQDWPYWLTQGEPGYDPNVLGIPSLDVGARIGTPGQAAAPAVSPLVAPSQDPLADAVGNGLPPGMNMTPPNDPVEHAARKQGWLGVIGKMFADPVMGDTLMRVGLQMMQPIKPGQTTGGHVANAIMGGADYKENREAGAKKETRAEAESVSKIALEKAHAGYYNRGGAGGKSGGGTAAEVQKVNQIAAALRAKDPERYSSMPGQDILDARELLDAYKREQIAAGILKGTVLPGQDVGAATDTAKVAAERLRTTGKPGATASPGKTQAPAAAIEYLKANDTPEVRAAFQAKYGYLP